MVVGHLVPLFVDLHLLRAGLDQDPSVKGHWRASEEGLGQEDEEQDSDYPRGYTGDLEGGSPVLLGVGHFGEYSQPDERNECADGPKSRKGKGPLMNERAVDYFENSLAGSFIRFLFVKRQSK